MGKSRKHECVCPRLDDRCEPHAAWQWGGGEPDICEKHGHGWTGDPDSFEEVRAKRDIMRAMRGFSPAARGEDPGRCHRATDGAAAMTPPSRPEQPHPFELESAWEAAVAETPLDAVLKELREEVGKARAKHPPMNSPHEGWAVILEELTPELWEHVCGDTGRSPEARHEALQVAAMGVRYILDLIDDPPEGADR